MQGPPRGDADAHGRSDVETVEVGGRWVNRMVDTGAVVSVNLTRSTALEAGAALARSWQVRHHVLYHSGSRPPR